jgi:hybrid polyketide synthase/nonribosomal peptide synthetase ACE1
VTETFASKLRSLLQIKTEDKDLMGMRSDDVGIDSLIAVEIRSWFLKNYEVNILVLSILGGMYISDVVDQAVRDVPEQLTPNIRVINAGDVESDTGKPLDLHETRDLLVEATSGNSSHNDISGLDELLASTPLSTEIDSELEILEEPVIERSVDLSFTQSMFWFVHALVKDKTTLNHTVLFRITGDLQVDDLKEAVTKVAQYHEALRTYFLIRDDSRKPMQGILVTSTLNLELSHVQQDSDVTKEYEEFRKHEFDLSSGEMMRIRLLTQSTNVNYLLVVSHHLILDGMSHLVFMKDLEMAYNGQELNPDVLQYPDYAIKQQEQLARGNFDNDVAYWKEEFATIPDALPLIRSRKSSRQPLDDYNVTGIDLRVSADLANRIRSVSQASRSTSFHVYLAAFEVLLYRLTNAREFAIGIADGNRKEEATLSSFGPYVNLLPIRFAIKSHTFRQAVAEARTKTYSALAHSQVPFEVLLNELRVTRNPSHSPIFQAFIDYRQGTREKQPFANCLLEIAKFEPGRTAYDLSIDIIDNPGSGALVSLMSQKQLYSESDTRLIANLYEDILLEFSRSPDTLITTDWRYRDAIVYEGLTLGRGEQALDYIWKNTRADGNI